MSKPPFLCLTNNIGFNYQYRSIADIQDFGSY
jgi:hypothetical protein